MKACGCRWDGNLDGRFMRCRTHQEERKAERQAHKRAEQVFRDMMSQYRATTDSRGE